MGANIAGIYGAQIFRPDDKPRYRRGFSINIAVITLALTLAVVRFIDDLWRRRRNGGQLPDPSSSEHNSHDEDDVKVVPSSDGQPQPILIEKDLQPVVPHVLR